LSRRLIAIGAGWLRSVGEATGAFVLHLLLGLIILVVAVYFFLADGPAMVRTVMRLSPLEDRHEQELLGEFDRVSRAVVVATLLSAVVQGMLAGLGFWVAGLGSVFLLSMLTAVLALIPFVGAAAVWLAVSLWLFFVEQHYVASLVLAAYGVAVVSAADNVIKPLVLHGQSKLHPLLALLSVLGGAQALGPVGILVGPMVVVFLQTLLNILHRELSSLEARPTARRPPGPLPFILSLRLRGLRLTYPRPRKVR
jgi:predicted PurR-regulated permease PerM